jgi:uncharacterized protein
VRVVLDTNVLLPGLLFHGLCQALLDKCFGPQGCTVVLSEHILTEFQRHAGRKMKAPLEDIRGAVEFLRHEAEFVEPFEVPADACRDPDDLPILGTLLAAKADCLVTGDADLLELGEFRGIPILSPRAFYERLR